MNKQLLPAISALLTTGLLLTGCGHSSQPVMMAPPTNPVTVSQSGMAEGQQSVYNWTEVPANQQVPITRAVFDQGGYQLFSPQGTIVVPFANQNMYVMKFGQSATGAMYFVNNGQVPTLFLPPGAGLENAGQQGARWYPFPQNYNYQQPVYVGLAPSWSAFTGMGWYPGMSYYGGYWGASPYSIIGPMIGLHFLIGGSPYYGWNSYHSYYNSHPGYAPMRVVNRTVYNQAARTSFNRNSFGSRPSGGGFGNRSYGGRSYGGSSGSGSFGRRPFGSAGSTFGGGSRRSSGSFGSGPSGYGGSFGGGRRSVGGSFGSGSFGGGSSAPSRPAFGGGGSFGSPRPSSGGSFGGGGSFGSSRPSSGGGSFGGGSFGGGRSSFGGGRRR